ncbi:[FeFe] hydrogenase H-cluster radical SAM maturase HydE [Myxococcota bacterium]|nr:[FeFe] hydrogenase H-cluster radical SAM maturase HydE [Myxococcota bacterium]MBU1381196.1 [FeFe] hydrogenase H-cluster radical SAM maturase HydE [Myxococcota bacterium]MBU1495618.1 [FeFe] hydrogenase H-cluster radical SAM maturase HydE [Myxococcota bacterium]
MNTHNLLRALTSENDKTPIIFELLNLKSDTDQIYALAKATRDRVFGNKILLRGIIEFSSFCRCRCSYCGIGAGRRKSGYRMTKEEILEQCADGKQAGYATFVLQSGEDPTYSVKDICDILSEIHNRFNVAVTLSIGEFAPQEYARFHASGCDRYLLRFETSNASLYAALHEGQTLESRLECIENIKKSGIQVGSGFLIGISPDLNDLAKDIALTTTLALDMIGCGPFIADNDTPLAGRSFPWDPEIALRTMAILRILNPLSHIPSTTAFDVLIPTGRDELLKSCANVYMPNITRQKYRADYQLYPGKPGIDEDCSVSMEKAIARIRRCGLEPSFVRGDSLLKTTFPNFMVDK